MRKACKAWLKDKTSKESKEKYIQCQKQFNRLVKQKKHTYRQFQRLQLVRDQKKNSRKFWIDVKKVGLTSARTKKGIPLEVTLEDGSILSDINDVTKKVGSIALKLY